MIVAKVEQVKPVQLTRVVLDLHDSYLRPEPCRPADTKLYESCTVNMTSETPSAGAALGQPMHSGARAKRNVPCSVPTASVMDSQVHNGAGAPGAIPPLEAEGNTASSSIAPLAPIGDAEQPSCNQAATGGGPVCRKVRQRPSFTERRCDRGPLDDTGLCRTSSSTAMHYSQPEQGPQAACTSVNSAYPDARSAGDQNPPVSTSTSRKDAPAAKHGDEGWVHASAHTHTAMGSTAVMAVEESSCGPYSTVAHDNVVVLTNGKYRPGSPPQNGKLRNGMLTAMSAGTQQVLELAAIANGLAGGLHSDDQSSSSSSDTGLQALIVEQAKAASQAVSQGQQPRAPGHGAGMASGSSPQSASSSEGAGASESNSPSQSVQGSGVQDGGDDQHGSSTGRRGGEQDAGFQPYSELSGSTDASQASSRDSREGREGVYHGGGSRNAGGSQRNPNNWNAGGGNGSYSMQGGGLTRGKGSRGSYNNLHGAGQASGGRHAYRGGNYRSAGPQYGGGSSHRASMDDTMLGQVGPIPQRPPSRGAGMAGREVGVQASMDSSCNTPTSVEPTGMSDLDRFLLQVTPIINLDASGQPAEEVLQNLCLEDVWRFYLEPSLYGREVYTLGGSCGPSLCYFVPYLSAMQLFTPASTKDRGTNRLHVCDTEGWPKHMHLRFEHFETELPFNRHPMYEHMEMLSQQHAAQQAAAAGSSPPAAAAAVAHSADVAGRAQGGCAEGALASPSAAGEAGTSQGPPSTGPEQEGGTQAGSTRAASSLGSTPTGSRRESEAGSAAGAAGPAAASRQPGLDGSGLLLRDTLIKDLHPASWYAVAWYPVYRIPDAPLVTRFLTFHSFAPIVNSIQNSLDMLQEGREPVLGSWPVPVHGLKWYNMHGERWLEPLTDGHAAGGRDEQHPGGGGGRGGAGGHRGHRQLSQAQYVQARNIDIHYHAVLGELQATAERFARGRGLRLLGQMGAEEVRVRHPDFEFFHTRG